MRLPHNLPCSCCFFLFRPVFSQVCIIFQWYWRFSSCNTNARGENSFLEWKIWTFAIVFWPMSKLGLLNVCFSAGRFVSILTVVKSDHEASRSSVIQRRTWKSINHKTAIPKSAMFSWSRKVVRAARSGCVALGAKSPPELARWHRREPPGPPYRVHFGVHTTICWTSESTRLRLGYQDFFPTWLSGLFSFSLACRSGGTSLCACC